MGIRSPFRIAFFGVLTLTAITFGLAVSAQAQAFLYSFPGGWQGGSPLGALVFDQAGNLYGTASAYGFRGNCINPVGCGIVFKVSPGADGWTETVLHTFSGGWDGGDPSSNLIVDKAGNLYGTTAAGGNSTLCHRLGCGVVFELSPASSGAWKETVLHAFSGGRDGMQPTAGLTFDNAGNLYGTTESGGSLSACFGNGCGTVFELSPKASGPWKEIVLRSFLGVYDGANPLAGLVFDTAGNLYGTTSQGGSGYTGTVFRLAPLSGGAWQETVLYRFLGPPQDGFDPRSTMVFDTAGNLYGTTVYGGSAGIGAVFELSPGANGAWKETLIASLTDSSTQGAFPVAGVAFDAGGNLWGTASSGGFNNSGGVFELSAGSDGSWTIQRFIIFDGYTGATPAAGLILDASGNFYGTTEAGGPLGYGEVFEITP
jgi:uncharacterized repeat protein (TIGR03803 family)